MTDLELMQQALDALEEVADEVFSPYDNKLGETIIALRERLAQPEQEPVEWQHRKPIMDSQGNTRGYYDWLPGKGLERWPHRRLYTSPPEQRKPLTDGELADLWYKKSLDWLEFARSIEAAHGIKGDT